MKLLRKFREQALTEIGGHGGFCFWRYYDVGVTVEEMMEEGFFTFFQHRASPNARIALHDMFKLHGSDGLVECLVTEVGLAPDFTPVLTPTGKTMIFASDKPARKAA